MAGPAFLGGAGSRLLPASIPFRFFGAAGAFHVLAWLLLIAGADMAPAFAGGLGRPLAALHAVTLGVLAMTAIGASLQLLPVATRQPIGAPWGPRAVAWLYLPGVVALVTGMALPEPRVLAAGAVAVVAGLLLYAALIARNLIRARGMRVVVLHAWIALAALAIALAAALALVGDYVGVASLGRSAATGLHVGFALYGFMGVLLMGFSYILLPMLALADAPRERPALASALLALAALLLAAAGAFGLAPSLLGAVAAVLGVAALAIHVALMTRVLRSGMRRALGWPLRLMQLGWAGIAASLVAALALALAAPLPRLATLAGVLAVAGLLSFVLGVLARIVPFLAAMHAGAGQRRPPTPSAFTAERPLAWHFAAHATAIALLIAAVLADSAWLARAAGAAGTLGAVAYGVFLAHAWRRI